jgi:SAM-dependent methyltransferase
MNTIALQRPYRRPYQGVLQILQFNWRFYVATAGGVGVALLALPHLPPLGRIVLLPGAALALFWMASSLAVSHYVYDHFPLYDLSWISSALSRQPRRWMNIHSGLDETSDLLAAIFPDSAGEVVDIFDPQVMTEASIRRAREVSHCETRSTRVRYDSLGFGADCFDAAFAIFAAHELRQHEQRVQLFGEIARVLTPAGELILMEHSRDWRNFLAFGPGFLHFFSQKEWRKAATEAGLLVRNEFSMTPFIRVYVLRKAI